MLLSCQSIYLPASTTPALLIYSALLHQAPDVPTSKFRVAVPEVAPPLNPVPAVTPVISPLPLPVPPVATAVTLPYASTVIVSILVLLL